MRKQAARCGKMLVRQNRSAQYIFTPHATSLLVAIVDSSTNGDSVGAGGSVEKMHTGIPVLADTNTGSRQAKTESAHTQISAHGHQGHLSKAHVW
jgi:hypothetical protein